MPTPSTPYDFRRSGCYLGQCAGPNIVNQEIIVASGAGVLYPGTVLGQITSSKKFVLCDASANDGSQNAAAILFHKVDATSADATTVATTNGPATINGNDLIFKSGISGANQSLQTEALRARGMKVLPQRPSQPSSPPPPPASESYRYFRITPKKAGGPYGQTPDQPYYAPGAGEIVFRDDDGPLSQAGYTASTESTAAYGQGAGNLVDGDPSTSFQVAYGGAVNAGRFVIDTGAGDGIKPASIDIYAHPASDSFNINSCTVEASVDGEEWDLVADVPIDGLVYTAGVVNLSLTYPPL